MGGAGDGSVKVSDEKKCKYCPKKGTRDELKDHWKPSILHGTNVGKGQILAKNILAGKQITEHNLYINKRNIAPQAHHLISSEAMRNDKFWEEICKTYGYDINCKENGVFLPSEMKLACHLQIPLHKGGHSAGYGIATEDETISYPKSVMRKLKDLKEDIEKIECNKDKGKEIIKKLNALSSEIFGYISKFTWTITYDGFDYKAHNPIGCANCSTLKEKKELFIKKLKGIEIDQKKRLPSDYVKIKNAKRKVLQEIFCEEDDGFGKRNHGSSFKKQEYILTISK